MVKKKIPSITYDFQYLLDSSHEHSSYLKVKENKIKIKTNFFYNMHTEELFIIINLASARNEIIRG